MRAIRRDLASRFPDARGNPKSQASISKIFRDPRYLGLVEKEVKSIKLANTLRDANPVAYAADEADRKADIAAVIWSRGKAYSPDLRERVFAAAGDGAQIGQIARRLRVSKSYVSKALSRRRTTGETSARPQRGHRASKLAELHDAIRDHVTDRPEVTIEELRAWLLDTHKVAASVGLVWQTLTTLGVTLKRSGRRSAA